MSELQHPDARSFETVAELYERVRPEYPAEAIDWLVERLGIDARSTVLDLGAGTGKLTRLLVPRAGHVIAVEPGREMLAQLERAVPGAEPVLAAAEAIPLPDRSVDAVVCGQSFHWFRAEEAVAEIRRVLRAGRGLGLIWNLRHPADELQWELTALLRPFVPPGRPPMPTSVRHLVDETGFADVERAEFELAQTLDAEGVSSRVASISFVAAAPAAARQKLMRAVCDLVDRRGGTVPFRHRTEVYVTYAV